MTWTAPSVESLTAGLETRYYAPGDPRMKLHKHRSSSSSTKPCQLPPLVQQRWIDSYTHGPAPIRNDRDKLKLLEIKVATPGHTQKFAGTAAAPRLAPPAYKRRRKKPAKKEQPAAPVKTAEQLEKEAVAARQSAAQRAALKRRKSESDGPEQLPGSTFVKKEDPSVLHRAARIKAFEDSRKQQIEHVKQQRAEERIKQLETADLCEQASLSPVSSPQDEVTKGEMMRQSMQGMADASRDEQIEALRQMLFKLPSSDNGVGIL